jgi:hypothetical protein
MAPPAMATIMATNVTPSPVGGFVAIFIAQFMASIMASATLFLPVYPTPSTTCSLAIRIPDDKIYV